MRPLAFVWLVVLCACDASHKASASGELGSPTARELAQAIEQRDDLKAAQALIDQGHPWRATQLLAPILRVPSKRTPEALVVAARAAAGRAGWPEVDKL